MYDVTKYMENHPGGIEVLQEAAGSDASEAFDNAGHSEDAFEIMQDLCVGTLKGAKKKAKPVRVVAPSPQTSRSGSSGFAKFALLTLSTVALSFGYINYGSMLPAISALSFPRVGSRGGGASSSSYVGGLGFFKGVVFGAGILTAVHTFLAQKLMHMIRGEKDFLTYPAHYKVPKAVESDILLRRGWLDPVTYQGLPLVKKLLVAPNVYRLIFDLPTQQTITGLPIGQHVAISANVNGESVTRSYTPVSNNSDKGKLELVVKVYPDGKLTNGFLAQLEVGDEVQFRGPKGAMRYSRGLCKKIGMLAGGSGITPMFQLIRAICENDRDMTEISLIYANRTEQDILLRDELDSFARRYPKTFKVHYLLDQPPADWQFGSGYVTKDMMAERFPTPSGDDSKIMLCGPPGMVNAAKRSLVELGFQKPGAMSKMTDEIFLF